MGKVYLRIKCCNDCPKSRGCKALKKTFNQLRDILKTNEFLYMKDLPKTANPLDYMVMPDCPLYKKKYRIVLETLEAENKRLKEELKSACKDIGKLVEEHLYEFEQDAILAKCRETLKRLEEE